ncbi:hypothetical protein CC1G_07661 [Coprinopsis cinerea okayama7|uniref:Integral membrane protein n=1 Tax=Coprinopsis cinerea (strain Okayama-7 / 130 / ATCC MYA-4618 / FGSC 9003) TaxID=240176 RepID=A8NC57_COPC7|nr:hypothetical protein CC1G_07661 [Coprinopsis cinerea okayama7\|eukprot:XP_001832401.2 hypothetical protein CC1G_07661 [Coprinopsis cinerea okayama7\
MDEDAERAYMKAGYAALVVALVLYGMQIFMVFNGVLLYREAPRQIQRTRRPYTILSCVICALYSVGVVTDLVKVEKVFVKTEFEVAEFESSVHWSAVMGATCIFIGNLAGDALLVYRCYLIWQDLLFVLAFPVIVFFVFAGLGIAYLVKTSVPGAPHPAALSSAWYMFSAILNIVVTGLIVGRLMHARRRVASVLTLVELKVYTGVVAVLIESALPLCLAAIIAAIVNLPQVVHPSRNFFTSLWVSLSAFCPQLIIYRVASGRSYTGDPVRTRGVDSRPLDLEFATTSRRNDTTLDELELTTTGSDFQKTVSRELHLDSKVSGSDLARGVFFMFNGSSVFEIYLRPVSTLEPKGRPSADGYDHTSRR